MIDTIEQREKTYAETLASKLEELAACQPWWSYAKWRLRAVAKRIRARVK